MGIINRALLFLYTLFIGLLSLGVILVWFQVLPERVLLNEYQYIMGQWQTSVAAGAMLVLSIHLIFCCFASSNVKEVNAKDIMVVKGENGEVNVSLLAIKNMAEHIVKNINGVNDAKAKVRVEHRKNEGDFLKLQLKLTMGAEGHVPAVSDIIREKLDKYIRQNVGLDNCDLTIEVQNIVSGVHVKKGRVN